MMADGAVTMSDGQLDVPSSRMVDKGQGETQMTPKEATAEQVGPHENAMQDENPGDARGADALTPQPPTTADSQMIGNETSLRETEVESPLRQDERAAPAVPRDAEVAPDDPPTSSDEAPSEPSNLDATKTQDSIPERTPPESPTQSTRGEDLEETAARTTDTSPPVAPMAEVSGDGSAEDMEKLEATAPADETELHMKILELPSKEEAKVEEEGPAHQAEADEPQQLPASAVPQEALHAVVGKPEEGQDQEAKAEQDDFSDEIISDAFVNHGLALWEKRRHEWLDHHLAASASEGKAFAKRTDLHASPLDVDEIIDFIFASPRQVREAGGPRRFPQAVSLPQMVDILVDLWEAEGLDI